MRNQDVDEDALQRGEYCHRMIGTCFCKVGWPVERQHEPCRGKDSRMDYCECAPETPEEAPLNKVMPS